jgi:hypothetical protein
MTDKDRLKHAFEQTPSLFQLCSTIRSRRVGHGYRIDSGTEYKHPATGRLIKQQKGPMQFISKKQPTPLSKLEEALIAWAACGPNGLVAWDISLDGGFHELTWIAGRTTPHPGNSLATDLLIINDEGAFIYKPTTKREKPIETLVEVFVDAIKHRVELTHEALLFSVPQSIDHLKIWKARSQKNRRLRRTCALDITKLTRSKIHD